MAQIKEFQLAVPGSMTTAELEKWISEVEGWVEAIDDDFEEVKALKGGGIPLTKAIEDVLVSKGINTLTWGFDVEIDLAKQAAKDIDLQAMFTAWADSLNATLQKMNAAFDQSSQQITTLQLQLGTLQDLFETEQAISALTKSDLEATDVILAGKIDDLAIKIDDLQINNNRPTYAVRSETVTILQSKADVVEVFCDEGDRVRQVMWDWEPHPPSTILGIHVHLEEWVLLGQATGHEAEGARFEVINGGHNLHDDFAGIVYCWDHVPLREAS